MLTDSETWERERLMESLDSYRRGVSDAPYLRKWTGAPEAAQRGSGAEQDAREMSFVVSTDEVDRHGDAISLDGWRLQSYMRNPVFLWAHDYTRPAIGRTVDMWTEGRGLHARIQFAPTDFAREISSLYQGGYQKGVSVGFRPIQYEMRRDTKTGEVAGIHFIEQELLEISAAPVPANQNALRKALDGAPRMQQYYSCRGWAAAGDDSVAWDTALAEVLEALRGVRQDFPVRRGS